MCVCVCVCVVMITLTSKQAFGASSHLHHVQSGERLREGRDFDLEGATWERVGHRRITTQCIQENTIQDTKMKGTEQMNMLSTSIHPFLHSAYLCVPAQKGVGQLRFLSSSSFCLVWMPAANSFWSTGSVLRRGCQNNVGTLALWTAAK